MSVDLAWREPRKDLLTPHGTISQNVLGKDNFLIITPNSAYEGIFRPLHLQWWSSLRVKLDPGRMLFLFPCLIHSFLSFGGC